MRKQMVMARSAVAAIVFLAILWGGPRAVAADEESGTLSLVVENDLFYDRDRNYTSGVALLWVPAEKATPDWALQVARRVPWFPEAGRVRHGYVIGQSMYTPRDITLRSPPPDDRPYAGWLYAAIGLGVETGRRLDQLALTVGVVGPASLAEQSQKLVHKIKDVEKPEGWDGQLGTEPGLILSYQRSWRQLDATPLAGLALDLTPHLGGAIGNVYTYANAGLTLRVGERLPRDYGPPRIQPSLPGSGFFVTADRYAWYAFAGFEGRAVARNIFLDGSSFSESRSVDKRPLVGDLQWGVTFTWRSARLSYTHVRRTREFETQRGHDDFGAVTLGLSF